MDIRERLAIWALRLLGVGFVLFGALFAFAPEATLRTFNRWGEWFGITTELPPEGVGFWRVLTIAFMVIVTVLAFWGSVRTPAQRALLTVLIIGKATSSLTALAFYLWERPLFIYLLNFVVDGAIALLVGVCLMWLQRGVSVPSR
ncbi:MAG: hypothetical protein ABDI19_12285 [Armatimonadota bacterium]